MSGRLIVMGSGEMAPALVATHRRGIEEAGADTVTILDAPFGFQENVPQLTERLVTFFRTSLGVDTEVASLRRVDAPVLQREQMLAAVRRSRYVFAGPGSPSYALRVWRGTGLDAALADVVAAGGTVTFASAAALTLGVSTIPVYEIYKVGEDPFWLEGLGVTSRLRLPITVIPHWNNAEGGNHDTSRCYIGARRLAVLERELDAGILGVDEHTAVTLDIGAGTLDVAGVGGAVLRGATDTVLASGETATLAAAAEHWSAPPPPQPATLASAAPMTGFAAAMAAGDSEAAVAAVLDLEARSGDDAEQRRLLRSMIVELGRAAATGLADPRLAIAPHVEALLELRERARGEGRYADADAIRDRLIAAGVQVGDTADGVVWTVEA